MQQIINAFADFAGSLDALRNPDGGFGPRRGVTSEPEPTALGAIALDDAEARAWLIDHQAESGGFPVVVGSVLNDSAAPLAALALDGAEREAALDALVALRAAPLESSSEAPFDDRYLGWPWTAGAFGWIEPTARAVLAMRILRPAATEAIGDGLGVLRDRECVGGGWNYGNRIVLDEPLAPYAQTTAIAMLALQGLRDEVWARGIARLRELWRAESGGGLSLALAAAALRVNDDPDHADTTAALEENFERTAFAGDVVSLAWAAIAAGPGLDRMRVAG
jgi:hypothetical protein